MTARAQLRAFLKERHPFADDEELYERMERLQLAVEWRTRQQERLECSKCRELKPTSAYFVRSEIGRGFSYICRECW